jgi:hypothetical protein
MDHHDHRAIVVKAAQFRVEIPRRGMEQGRVLPGVYPDDRHCLLAHKMLCRRNAARL